MLQTELAARVEQSLSTASPSAVTNWAKWILAGCGIDVEGIEEVLAMLREARREALRAEIAAVDTQVSALAEQRQALVQQLQTGQIR